MGRADYEKLLKKYKTKQPGEKWDKKTSTEDKRVWNMSQKIRTAEVIMGRCNIKEDEQDRVIKILTDIPDLSVLHGNCTTEKIISCICFYVIKTRQSNRRVNDYKVFKEYKLEDSTCLIIFARLAEFYQKRLPVYS